MSTSSSSILATASTDSPKARWFDSSPVRVGALLVAIMAPAVQQALSLSAFTDNDIWWHLRTGLWILQNHAIPRTGLFSQWGSLPWIDTSWGFDLLVATAYHFLGLTGLPLLQTALQVAVACGFFVLGLAASHRFWPAVVLTAIAQCCLVPFQPRPALCSIFFLAIELRLLITSRRSGDTRLLFLLPPIFLIWANVDRQFAYGLMTLALFCLTALAEHVCRESGRDWFDTGLPPMNGAKLGLAAGASLLATFVSPYTYHLHALLWQSAFSTAADRYFRPLHAMRFRQPQDYLLVLLVVSAFFALGRRLSRDLFLIALMIISAAISFRLQRDNWLVVLVSICIVASALPSRDEDKRVPDGPSRFWPRESAIAAVLGLALVLALGLWIGRTKSLQPKIALAFPIAGADYIRQNQLPTPIFNAYEWGGFLTWYLPEYPVYIDGRIDLYGDGVNIPYFKLMHAEIPLQSDPGFLNAQTFLLQRDSPLGLALTTLPGFHVAYRDSGAVVIVRGK